MLLTLRGWCCLLGGIAWTLAALYSDQRDTIWPGVFLAVLPLISLVLMLPCFRRVRFARETPGAPISVGQRTRYHLRVRIPWLLPGGLAAVTENMDSGLGQAWQFQFPVGFTGAAGRFEIPLMPHWRGKHEPGPGVLIVKDPLRMARAKRQLPKTGDSIVVVPKIFALESHQSFSPGDQLRTLSPSGRQDIDDVLLREYRPGDDTRRIHWRASAKLGELLIRQEEQGHNPKARILLDNRAAAYGSETVDLRFELAISWAGSICAQLLTEGFEVELLTADGPLGCWTAGMGHAREAMLLQLAFLHRSQRLHLPLGALAGQEEFVAVVLGRVIPDDLHTLAPGQSSGARKAVLIQPDADSEPLVADPADALRALSWSTASAALDVPPARTWAELLGGRR
ncbi:MAG: DUF58 domain-containing protein [Propionibacteriaceae bacterium]|jgi:uncharacterized protein (DUF58 family)|nr:DUF58 domain-containing protein [Propionibacteriaceae bacterium]